MFAPLILIAEDNQDDLFFLTWAFRQHRLPNPVEVVRDGYELIQYLEGQGQYADRGAYPLPGYLFLDLHLPRRSGLEVLAWLREHPPQLPLRIIAWSCSYPRDAAEQAVRLGADHVFEKPTRLEDYRVVLGGIPGLSGVAVPGETGRAPALDSRLAPG